MSQEILAGGGVPIRQTPNGSDYHYLLCFRPRYGDWTIPKGKLEDGEEFLDGALREVEEETALRCRAIFDLGELRYSLSGEVNKVVHYWVMEVIEDLHFTPNEEVTEVRWLTFGQATELASYEGDKIILQRAKDYLSNKS